MPAPWRAFIETRAAKAGFDSDAVGGHSLKRGALTTDMDRGVRPTRLKQFGRYKSYAVLDEYFELAEIRANLVIRVAEHVSGRLRTP
jgi:hypothetical protein